MANNVKFYWASTQAKYDAAVPHDEYGLYFVIETQRLYKGDVLIGTGAAASEAANGLLSKEDYVKLQELINSSVATLEPVDSSIVIADGKIGVQISKEADNALELKADGLYAVKSEPLELPVVEYAMEKVAETTTGSLATYKLKKTVDGVAEYVGDAIEINREIMLQSGSLEVVTEDGKPYPEAVVGDKYLALVLNDEDSTPIYVPVNGLVDTVKPGIAITVENNTVGVNLSPVEGNILTVNEDGGLFVPATDLTGYVTSEALEERLQTVTGSIVWEEM